MNLIIAVVLCAGIWSSNAVPVYKTRKTMSNEVALAEALNTGNIERYQELMKDRDVNTAGKHGKTPLHYVSEHGDEKFLEYLIKRGADMTVGDDEGNTAMHFGAINPNKKVMKMLIKQGGDVNKANKVGDLPIHFAGLNPNVKVMKLLLNNGASTAPLNNDQETPLHWAAANRNEKVADLLIKKGIEIKQQNGEQDTALHLSALSSNVKIAELLIKAGADVNAHGKDDWTPIFYAVINGNEMIITKMMADLDEEKSYANKKAAKVIIDHWKHPVHKHANEKLIELLVNNGANINQKATDYGITPYAVAEALGDDKMMEFLVKHGATSTKNGRNVEKVNVGDGGATEFQ